MGPPPAKDMQKKNIAIFIITIGKNGRKGVYCLSEWIAPARPADKTERKAQDYEKDGGIEPDAGVG